MDMAQAPGASNSGNAQNSVRFGVYSKPGNHAGKTITQVREELGKMWGVPTDAAAHVGKTKVGDDYVLQPGDSLEFHRRAGEKG